MSRLEQARLQQAARYKLCWYICITSNFKAAFADLHMSAIV